MTPAPGGPADESVFVRGLPPGQHESLLYVWTSAADQTGPAFLSVLDADPASSSYGKVIATAPTGSPGNEAHHFGYTANADRIFAGGLFSNRLFIYDVATDPKHPKLVKTVPDLAASTGFSGPHTFYAVPGGVMVAMLGSKEGGAPGGGFINCAFGNSVWHWQVGPDGKLAFHRVIKLPDGSLPADMRISYDNKFLFVSLFGGGAVQQYDVADPMQPKLVSTVAIPQAQMMKLTPDNKRLYVSNSLLSNLDGKVPYRVRLVNVGPSGMTLDAKFDVDFEHFPTGQARPHDMLLK